MTEEKDVWEVERRALLEIIGDLPTSIIRGVSAVIQGMNKSEAGRHKSEAENLTDF